MSGSARQAWKAPLVAAVASGLGAVVSSWLLRNVALSESLRFVVAFAPAPLFLWLILAELHALRRLDEFYRRVLLDSLAIAFPAAILVGVTIDGLQKGGFVLGWSVGDVWPFMALLWVPCFVFAYRRYDRGG